MDKTNFLNTYAVIADRQNRIPSELYEHHNVKRGLRNADGTGVLVGLTEIGQVHGYILDEGEKISVPGVLRFRGIDVRDIVSGFQDEKRFGFEETIFLLIFGYLPSSRELDEFCRHLGDLRKLPDRFTENMILKFPGKNIMNILSRSILSLYTFDEKADDTDISNVLKQSVELIGRFPTIIAHAFAAYKHYFGGESLFIHEPDPELGNAANLLMMIRPDKSYTALEAEVLDLVMVLHAEHGGGNNSAFSTHVVSSSGTDTYSAVAAAICSLKGPLHGGASIKVRDMMKDIMAGVADWTDREELSSYLGKILTKQAFDGRGLIYGLGHAVYTLSDPRTELLKARAAELSAQNDLSEEYELYEAVEGLASEVFHRVTGKAKDLCANVDFYSGFVYHCLGIPKELFTPIFAASRIAGWCAHRVEELVSGNRIIRPAYRSITRNRPYTPMAERG